MLASWSRDIRPKKYGGLEFQGKVVNIDDGGTGKKMQRIQVRVPKLHDCIENDADLPWSYPRSNNTSVNSSNGEGNVNIPTLGSTVSFSLRDESHYHPEYSVGPTTTNLQSKELTEDQNYIHKPAHINRSGSKTAVDTEADTVEHTHVTGTQHLTDGYGQMQRTVASQKVGPNAKKLFDKADSDHVQGDKEIACTGKLTIQASSIEFVCSGDIKFSVGGQLLMLVTKTMVLKAAKDVIKLIATAIQTSPDPTPGASDNSNPTSAVTVRTPAARTRPQEVQPSGGPSEVS